MTLPLQVDCLVINLDRSPDRLAQMQSKLAKLGMPFRRVSAVDAKTRTFTEHEVSISKYEKLHGKHLIPAEVGCYLSHYDALKTFLSGGRDIALILEDDMCFADGFLSLMEELVQIRDSWDMVKLNGTRSSALPVTRQHLSNGYKLILNYFHQPKSGAYLVNRKAATNFVSGLLPMSVPYDHEFIKFWKYDIRLFSVRPFPTWEEEVPSTIDFGEVFKNKKAWYQRGRTAAYRTGVMLKRLWYASLMTRQPDFAEMRVRDIEIPAKSSAQSGNR